MGRGPGRLRALGRAGGRPSSPASGSSAADPDDDRAGEIGWRLPRAAWGHGYAVEGAAALLDHAFDTLGLDRVWAETMAVNTRSRRVMERLGMTHLRTEVRDWEDPIPGWEQGEVVHEPHPRAVEGEPVTDSLDETRALWDDEAQTFDDAADHGLHDPAVRAAWRALMLDLLPPAPARVADLGCGTGTLALLLTEEGYDVTGVDVSPEMVRRARAKAPGVEFVRGRRVRAAARPRVVRRGAEPARALGDARPRRGPGPLAATFWHRADASCWSRAAGRPGPG